MCMLSGRKGREGEEMATAPSYAGPRNVRVLTLYDPRTVRLWESFILILMLMFGRVEL